ncbi:MAG: aldose 1-epimerase [Alphaproteobacteria bacterium]|nr:aldose 1-epimerase [Alphaproteobacteria bacterium]
MVELVELSAGAARACVAPALGGGVARLDVAGKPVLRPFEGNDQDLFSLASNILVPFSNRISGGGFAWRGRFMPVPPNLAGEPFPIHGDGFQKAWDWSLAENRLELFLENGAIGPWRYRARQMIEIRPVSFRVTLNVTNTAEIALPFGGGFHPWFPRSAETRLAFDADAVWLEDEKHLPTQHILLSDYPQWRFEDPRPLPQNWLNNGYTNWKGGARIEQGPDAVSCSVSASEDLKYAQVYSPGEGAEYFCFEPVSHPVDALHLPDAPGLQELEPGDSMRMSIGISWNTS